MKNVLLEVGIGVKLFQISLGHVIQEVELSLKKEVEIRRDYGSRIVQFGHSHVQGILLVFNAMYFSEKYFE